MYGVKNFNDDGHLDKLSNEEIDFLPKLTKILSRSHPGKTIHAKDLVKGVNERRERLGLSKPFSDARLRKMVNYLRTSGALPIISDVKGYYVSRDPEDIRLMIRSLRSRSEAIEAAARGLNDILIEIESGKYVEPEIDMFGIIWK